MFNACNMQYLMLYFMFIYLLYLLGMGNMPSGASTRSVVYSSYLHGGKPNPCSEKVALWLQKSSTGECPCVFAVAYFPCASAVSDDVCVLR